VLGRAARIAPIELHPGLRPPRRHDRQQEAGPRCDRLGLRRGPAGLGRAAEREPAARQEVQVPRAPAPREPLEPRAAAALNEHRDALLGQAGLDEDVALHDAAVRGDDRLVDLAAQGDALRGRRQRAVDVAGEHPHDAHALQAPGQRLGVAAQPAPLDRPLE
jgi:hypothetical protein